MRIARAKPEQAGSGDDGEAKQDSDSEISAGKACSRLLFFFFYRTASAELARTVFNTTVL